MADSKQDYYEVLGIARGADESTIKKAYYKLAKQYHPDVNPGDKAAEAKFKEVNEAYAVLSDPEKKDKYDRFGHAAFEGGAGGAGFGDFGGFDFGDIFSSFFGGGFGGGGGSRRNAPVRGDDIMARVTVSFEESVTGCKKDVSFARVEKCPDCGGSGAEKGSSAETCSKCGGSGQMRVSQRTAFGMFQSTRTCDNCRGTGKVIKNPCSNCRGTGYVRVTKKLEVSIPAGIDDGQRIAIRGMGNDGRLGGPSGDLYVNVTVRKSDIFERDGNDIYCEVPISFVEAALGAEIEIPTLSGKQKYQISEGTQTDTTFTLKGQGMPAVNGRSKGDLFVTVRVETPKGLKEKQKQILRDFAAATGERQGDRREKLFGKMFGFHEKK